MINTIILLNPIGIFIIYLIYKIYTSSKKNKALKELKDIKPRILTYQNLYLNEDDDKKREDYSDILDKLNYQYDKVKKYDN